MSKSRQAPWQPALMPVIHRTHREVCAPRRNAPRPSVGSFSLARPKKKPWSPSRLQGLRGAGRGPGYFPFFDDFEPPFEEALEPPFEPPFEPPDFFALLAIVLVLERSN
jgi:hypothetical protein